MTVFSPLIERPLGKYSPKVNRAFAVVLLVVVSVEGCHAPSLSRSEEQSIPYPSWATDLEILHFPDGQSKLSYLDPSTSPREIRNREFYGQWMDEDGWVKEDNWVKVDRSVDPWGVDEWQSFVDFDGSRVEQLLVHWMNPDKTESIRLVLRQSSYDSGQRVIVIRSPVDVMTDMAGGRSVSPDDSVCKDGHLVEPATIHSPLPRNNILQAQCVEPLRTPMPLLSIDSSGHVNTVDLTRGSGCETADEMIYRCLMTWVFSPATCDEVPIAVDRGVTFRLDDGNTVDRVDGPCTTPEGPD